MNTNNATKYHKEVFDHWGYLCFLHPGFKVATDAAHVLHRPKLGRLRYASVHFARPLCRECHLRVDTSLMEWPLSVRQDAVRAFNKIAKIPMEVPAE